MNYLFKENMVGIVEITQLLRTHTAPAEDQGTVPRMYTNSCTTYLSLTMGTKERNKKISLGIKTLPKRKTLMVKTIRH